MERVVSGKERKTESINLQQLVLWKTAIVSHHYLSLPFTKQYVCGAVMMEAFRI
jgi:hypothetical protein